MNIKITARDTVFFRDGRPFDMGEDTWASGLFPPLPSVFYGMIRTAFASQNEIPLNRIEEATKNLKINSILFKYDYKEERQFLFPFPNDLYKVKNKENINYMKLIKNNTISNIERSKYPFLLSPETNQKLENNFGNSYLDLISFHEYLNGEAKNFTKKDLDNIVEIEAKIGIAKNHNTNQTEEGKLYRVGMLRPKMSFVVNFDGLELKSEGLMRFGAEAKSASYIEVNFEKVMPPEITNEYLKLYIHTPAIFENGSVPKFILQKKYEGIELELITMSIGKPQFVGGFDIKERKPKPMKKAVPSGSVYYLKSNKAYELAEKLHSKSISEVMSEQGFGICYCGSLKPNNL